jgi:hypothetical protein
VCVSDIFYLGPSVKIENKILIGRHGKMQMGDMQYLLWETHLPLGPQAKNEKINFIGRC